MFIVYLKKVVFFIINLVKTVFKFFANRNSEWKEVKYPTRNYRVYLYFFALVIFCLYSYILVMISDVISSIGFNGVIGKVINILSLLLWLYVTYKGIKLIFINSKKSRSLVSNNLEYMIHTLKLYDAAKDGMIVRTIRILYKEDDNKVYVRVAKLGDRFTQISSTLGENMESTLGLELDSTNSTVDYFEYVFLKHRDKRIDLASSVNDQHNNTETIQISGNIAYRLSKTPHSLIVGGTGSGKSFFILGKIVSYLSLTPQAELYIVDPKKADLSLLRFIKGLEDRVATEPNQIAKMLREVVEIMEDRYKTYFNDISAFGKDYTDFLLPPIIIVFDEFSAFLHSVDKKLSKEVLDYIFTIVMKGRQAGVQVEILMQRPSADDLPTNIRAQMGFKAGLGAMDKIGYNMIFDTNNIDYKTVTEKGGGYIQIDGIHTAPVYFETPFIDENFDFIKKIEELMQNSIAD